MWVLWGLKPPVQFYYFHKVFGHDATGFCDLMSATEAVGHDFGAGFPGADGREEAILANFEAEIAVFIAKSARHAAAAGIDDLGRG